MGINSDETLDKVAKERVEAGQSLEEAMKDIPQEDRRYFAKAYRDFKTPSSAGEAVGRSWIGKVYQQILDPLNIPVAITSGLTYDWLPAAGDWVKDKAKDEINILSKGAKSVKDNFKPDGGKALDALMGHSGGMGAIESFEQGAVDTLQTPDPETGRTGFDDLASTATGGLSDPNSVTRMILDEVMNWDNEQITQLKLELQEAEDEGKDTGRLKRNLELAQENHRPYTTLISKVATEEMGYWFDRQALLNKIADEPHIVLSDFMSAVAIISSRGAALPVLARTNAGRTAIKVLQAIEKGADWADPFNLPHKGLEKFGEINENIRVGPDVNMTNQPRDFQFGRDESTGDMLEGQMFPDDAAEKFGAGKDMTPDDVRNKMPIFQTQEWARSEKGGSVGQGAKARVSETLDAMTNTRQRMLDDLNAGGNPLDAETGSGSIIELYNLRQDRDALEIKSLFSEWNQNYETPISPEFGLEGKLRKLVSDLRSGGASPSDRKAAGILEGEIDAMVEGGVSLNNMPLDKLDKIRTFFREAYDSSFIRPPTAAEMGAGSEGGKAYMGLTDLLYDAVRDTVDRSGGVLPDTLESGLRAAKKRRLEIANLERSEGGKFLLKTKKRPRALVDGLLNKDEITTEEIKNVYKLLGGDGVSQLQPILLNRMFENMGKQPDGLKKYLIKLKSGRDANRIVELFGGGNKGRQLSEQLHEFAEFSAEMMTTVRRLANSPTGKMVLFVENAKQGAAGAITGGLADIMQAVVWGHDMNAGLATLLFVGNIIKHNYPDVRDYLTVNSDWARKRLLEGHELQPHVGQMLDLLTEGTKRQYVKPAEKISGAMDTAETEGEIQFGNENFIDGYIDRGGRPTRRE